VTHAYRAEYAWLRRQPATIRRLYAQAVAHYALPLGFACLVRGLIR
jgi:hypothetical protein